MLDAVHVELGPNRAKQSEICSLAFAETQVDKWSF